MQFSLTPIQQKLVDSIVNKHKDFKFPNDSPNGEFRAYTNGIDKNGRSIIEKIFKEFLVGERIHEAMVLVALTPWRIHTDYNKGDENPGKAILIPWQTQNTSTIVFNEIAKDNNEISLLTPLENSVDRNFYKKYMQHCSWESAQKVSIKEIFNWERGKAVSWDRKNLHCSDDFSKNNIKNKIAIVIFTERIF